MSLHHCFYLNSVFDLDKINKCPERTEEKLQGSTLEQVNP